MKFILSFFLLLGLAWCTMGGDNISQTSSWVDDGEVVVTFSWTTPQTEPINQEDYTTESQQAVIIGSPDTLENDDTITSSEIEL